MSDLQLHKWTRMINLCAVKLRNHNKIPLHMADGTRHLKGIPNSLQGSEIDSVSMKRRSPFLQIRQRRCLHSLHSKVQTFQDKWKTKVEVHMKTTTDDCDIAWAALELVSSRRRECRRNWISSQVDSWLGGMVSQIRHDVTCGIVPHVVNPTNHISCLQIRFHDNAVRERLMKLMGTETVRILDRNFMATLADRLLDQNWEMTRGRIMEREKWERDREKQMVMDGMIPVEDGPEGFSEHPYFAIMRQVADDVAKKKAKMEAHQKRKRMNKMIDYSSLPITFKEAMDESTLSALALIQEDGQNESIDLILDENNTEECQESEGSLDTVREGVLTVRYEAPEVKTLRKAKTVEEMYRLADCIFFRI